MGRSRLVFIALSLTMVLLFVGGSILATNTGREADNGQDSLYKYLSVFTEVLGLVKRAYVEETDTDALLAGAFEGTIDALDPFSLYIPAEQVERYLGFRKIGESRSGLLLLKDRGVVFVTAIVEGSPAAAVDLAPSDVIVSVQGKPTRLSTLVEIQEVLAGPVGTEITLERLRLGQTATVKLKLEEYLPPGATVLEKQGIAVLHLAGFHAQTPKNIATILETLATGTTQLPKLTEKDKLVIDLRGIAGGDPASAYQAASYFVHGDFVHGDLGALLSRGQEVEAFKAEQKPLWSGRLVVLIDRGTQGAAEILATVLRQTADAVLIGERSFGHSGRQSLVELSNGGRLLITDAFFTGPDRTPINKSLVPDVPVRSLVLETGQVDPAHDPILDRGLEILRQNEKVELKKAA